MLLVSCIWLELLKTHRSTYEIQCTCISGAETWHEYYMYIYAELEFRMFIVRVHVGYEY